jgi:hypothetical protein
MGKHWTLSEEALKNHHTLTKEEHSYWKGKKMPEEMKKKMSLASLGKKKSAEHALNIGKGHLGMVAVEGDKQWLWKGDKVGYFALHHWVNRKLGKPCECVYCGSEKKLQWASVSHKAKRDLNDYISLCVSCHKNYDLRGGVFYG